MTIRQAIERTDAVKFNTYTTEEKVAWLSQLDGLIRINIMDAGKGKTSPSAFFGYNAKTDMDTTLLAPEPWDAMYLRWLEAQIDRANNEESYNATIVQFSAEYEAFEKYYIRSRKYKGSGKRFLF